jgi:subtilisin family serine protease
MAVDEAGRKRLKEQVEQILDEGTGERRSVIVRMEDPDTRVDALVGIATEAIRIRPLALTARDVLPDRGETLRGTKTAGQLRSLKGEQVSAAARVAAAGVGRATKQGLISTGHKAVQPLLGADVAKRSIEQLAKKEKTVGAPSLWSSRSVVLRLSPKELERLPAEVPEVADIFPNRPLRVPPVVKVKTIPQRAVDNKASAWGVYRIGAMAAWGAYEARGQDVKVAVLDTGVDPNHPALEGRIAGWAEFDASGQQVAGSVAHDTDQHGTHVAGTIAGNRANGRWIGVAPQAQILAALVLDGSRGGTDAQVLAGIDWALEQDAQVISMSLGGLTFGPEVPSAYTAAIVTALRAGVPVVAAIGNEGGQTSGSPGNDLFAFSVGATDPEDRAAGFSGGRTHMISESTFIDSKYLPLPYSKPEVSAPGVAVESSIPGGDYAVFSGTSMATPHVSGALALILGATNGLKSVPPEERAFLLQDLLISSVEELGESGQDHRFGFGRIDALRALGFADDQGFLVHQ